MRFLALLLAAVLCLGARTELAAEPAPPAAEAEAPAGMEMFYFVMLIRGPKWTAKETEATRKIQDAHMANMVTLHDEGKLILAGPFADEGKWRGLFLLRADSAAEAKAMVDADPAVKAGRLTYEIHPWMTMKGALGR